jgi:putative DNA primase/helicase
MTSPDDPLVAAVMRGADSATKAIDAKPNGEQVEPLHLVFNPKDPLPTAFRFVALYHHRKAGRSLHHHRGAFYRWNGSAYTEIAGTELRAQLYDMLSKAWRAVGKNEFEPFQPTASKVNDIIDALKAAVHLRGEQAAPCWIDGRASPPATEVLACTNGLLHLPTRKLSATTPAFFGLNAVDFNYDPDAPEPGEWTRFLDSLWRDDAEAIDCLQEIFGYLLTTDTRLQKMFLVVGPKRSGKGTIARVLKALFGGANVAGPTLSGLGTNFGLQPLIGKPLAVISDARLSGRADQHVIAERLLSISGEDLSHHRPEAPGGVDRHPADPHHDANQRAAAHRGQ